MTRAYLLLLCLCFAATLLSGCATRALWEEGRFARFHEPATPPNLQLYQSKDGQKALVVYAEEVDSERSRRKRAYWIDPHQPAPENPFRPKFVTAATAQQLQPIVLCDQSAANGLCVEVNTNGHAFALLSDGQKVSIQPLPTFEDGSGQAKQIALTPLALICDVTIIGGYLFMWWLMNGGPAGISGTL